MDARARRKRLPLAARIAAIVALVAVAGALAFGFTQSNAAPAPGAAQQTATAFSAPTLPAGVNPKFLPRQQDLVWRFSLTYVCFKSQEACLNPGPSGEVIVTWMNSDRSFEGRPKLGTPHRQGTGGNPTYVTDIDFTMPAYWLERPGPHELVLTYRGDANFSGTQKPGNHYIVNGYYTPSWQVTSTPNPSRGGDEVTFTATYNAPHGHIPTTKNARFYFELDNRQISENLTLDKSGNATFRAKNILVGTYKLSVRFTGDNVFNAARSYGQPHVVKPPVLGTSTELTVDPNPTTVGKTVSFKAKVTTPPGSTKPKSRVKFDLGADSPEVIVSSEGIAIVSMTQRKAGEFRVIARYLPDGDFRESQSREVVLKVSRAESKTAVTAKPEAAAAGKPVTLSATVTPPAGVDLAPSGTISFTDGAIQLGTCTPTSTWTCELTTDKLAPGKHTVTASFDGGLGLTPSSGTTSVRVFQGSTTTLTAGPSPVTEGSAVTLTAKVAGADPKITTPVAGKVTFLDGTKELGKSDVDKDGKATFSTTGLAAGTHSLTARYEGSDVLDPSTSQPVSVVVNKPATPGQGGGAQGGSQGGGSQNGSSGGGGTDPQSQPLPRTGASVLQPVGIGALLLILGAVAITLTRKRRRTR